MKKKLRKCREKQHGCEVSYVPWTSNLQMQACCQNENCKVEKQVKRWKKSEKKKRSKLAQEKREGRERQMSMSARLKRAREKGFQVWVKLRDFAWFVSIGKDPACIMCGNPNPMSWHACHFQSVGSKPWLQFHPANCNLGCGQCNYFAAQNDTEYEANMIIKYGQAMVDYLKLSKPGPELDQYDVEDIRKYYMGLSKELRK